MDGRLRIADLSQLPLPGTSVPGSLAFTPDGQALTYLYSADGTNVRSLWWHDLATGERQVIAGPPDGAEQEESLAVEEQLRRERMRTLELGVTRYAWAADAARPTLLVPFGRQILVGSGPDARTAAEALAPLESADDASAAILSPDGQQLAIVLQGDLWMAPLDGDGLRRLTDDAGPGVFNGLPEFAAAEELDRYDALWWSTDSRHFAFAHVDEGGVPPYMIGHLGAESWPAWEEHRYPFAGGPNAIVTLKVVGPDSDRPPVSVDLGMAADDYLARVVPEAGGSWLVAVLPRQQRSLRWLRVTTNGKASELWTEASKPWLNLDDHTRALMDGRILRSTERTGFRHLELRGANGAFQRQLTAGDWVVTDIAHVDEVRGEVLFLATADATTERQLYRVPLDAAEPIEHPERLTAEPGWHLVSVSRDGTRWADTWSTLDHAPTVVLRRRDARDVVVIHEPAVTAQTAGYLAPELLSVVAADGATPLDAGLYRPAKPAATPPPCVVWVYGGPRAQYVKRDWEMTAYPIRAYLAQCGVAVVVVDNRGATARGLAFEAVLAGELGNAEVADQVAAVRQLADAGEIDPARVAITGGSYGGFMTLMSLIREPKVFRAGVAIAPVTDQAGYDTAYTERYLGRPQDDPDAYERSSILPRAGELPDTALLIHGAIDENVHLRHSVRLVAALEALDRELELVILPDDRHRVRSADGLRTRDRRTVKHLLTALDVPLPAELADGGTNSPQSV